jgi:uncharacterized membrane protein
MSIITKHIDVNVPTNMAYNQWTQFETFPRFMEGVKEVKQLDDRRMQWRAQILGKETEWQAEITEQVPDKRIAWRSISGTPNAGVVTFHPVSENTCRVMIQMEYDPQGFVESTGDTLGLVEQRVEGDLARFKDFIESRGEETGAWRGKIAS